MSVIPKIFGVCRWGLTWLSSRSGYVFLVGQPQSLVVANTGHFRYAWLQLLVVSLLWGLASLGIWSIGWKLFGSFVDRFPLPAAAVAAVFVLWPYRQASGELSRLLGRGACGGSSSAASVLVMVLVLALMSLQRDPWYSDNPLPDIISWFRPNEKIFRVLLLMPLWGCWSMMITAQFCRRKENTEPAVQEFALGCGAMSTAVVMGLLLAASITYFNFMRWEQLAISGVTIATAMAGGIGLCRACGGICRQSLLSTNIVTQLAFLLSYLAARHLLFW